VDELDYEQIVALHHEDLYRFAFSLTGTADGAGELTQETYSRLLTKGKQIHDRTKIKSWLFTTLYRIFLGWKRRERRHPELSLDSVGSDLLSFSPTMMNEMDSQIVMNSLLEMEERFRAPLALFYLEELSYKEIAVLLDMSIGTVTSRLSRGKDLLQRRLLLRMGGKCLDIIL